MGAGIARVLSGASHQVTVFDANRSAADEAASRLPGVRACGTLEEALSGAQIVFEAIAENEGAKRDLFRQVGAIAPRAIIASNTSTILPSSLIEATADPALFVVAHFFNPADVVPLVEIVPAPTTSDATVAAVRGLLSDAGKQPVVLGREVPGFVANRLQAALLREAFALEREGVASFADIDRVVRGGLGSRWAAAGPFAVVDLGGLDIWAAVAERLFPDLAADTEVPDALASRVAEGRLGSKTGTGLFDHDEAADAVLRERISAHFGLEKTAGPLAPTSVSPR
jgi:3-hydroxybutyryl-CoA dehydrogenase